MPSVVQLNEMSHTLTNKIDKNTLIDIKMIKIDTSLSIEKRMLQYLEQIKNPYNFLCGGTPVKIQFSETGKTLDEAIKNHFLGLKTLYF